MRLRPDLTLEEDWYAVQRIDAQTFAIGEPHYHQQNWSYLLLGESRALMFDTGSFCRDITHVVSGLTDLPVTAMPSHMHYDHLGNIARFSHIAIADLPLLRACAAGNVLNPTEEIFLGAHENNEAPSFTVGEWVAIGGEIDLGGRQLEILHTPGHSPDSVSLLDAGRNILLAADFIYPGKLYAQVPGSDLADYLSAGLALSDRIDATTHIYCAHGNASEGDEHAAPTLARGDLMAMNAGLARIKANPDCLRGPAPWTIALSDTLAIIIDAPAAACWR